MTTNQISKRPSHYLYSVNKRSASDKGNWTRIGAAWPNSDGKGFSCKFDLMPINGADIVMREPKDDGDGQ